MNTFSPCATDLQLTQPVADPESREAELVSDAITDQLNRLAENNCDWRHSLAWAYDPLTAVQPTESIQFTNDLKDCIDCLDADALDGEARITIIRRAVNNFRCEMLDPENGAFGTDATVDELVSLLGLTQAEAQRRLETVSWGSLNPLFWGIAR